MAPIPQTDDDGRDRQPPDDHQSFDVEDIETPDFVINVAAESSESDDDDDNNHGYQLLPQEPREDGDNSDDDDDNSDDDEPVESTVCEDTSEKESASTPNTEFETSITPLPDLPLPKEQLLLCNQERCRQVSSMNQDHVEKIKSAMASFQLPVGHIPEWAKNVSEDQWKKNVMTKLQEDVPSNS